MRRPAVAGLLAAIAMSLTATRVAAVAIPWFVLTTTGSATRTGLVSFCEMAPYVLVKALSGPLIDRVGPRLVSRTADLASAVATLAVSVSHSANLLSLWLLLALVAVVGATRGPGDLAKEVMIPEGARLGRMRLERATGLAGMTERLAITIGPAIGGALVALVGPLTGLVVNAACFAAGSLIVTLALPRDMGRSTGDARNGTGYWRRFGEGLSFLRNDPLLLAIAVMVGVTNLLDAAFTSVFLPFWGRESGHGAGIVGLCMSVGGVTAIAGSLMAAANRLRRRPAFFLGFLVAGSPRYLILAVHSPVWAVLMVFALYGAGAGLLNPILGTVTFERVPRRLLGRVNALQDSLAWSGIPLGALIGGAAVAVFGLAPVLIAGGVAYLLTTTVTGLRPEWREMDRTRGRGRSSVEQPTSR
jgi:MFS family permease